MRLGVATLGSLAFLIASVPVAAADPSPGTTLTMSAPAAPEGGSTAVSLQLESADGTPLADEQVTLQRRTAGAWTDLDPVTTDADGTATESVTLTRVPDDNVVRATFAGDAEDAAATATLSVALQRRRGVVTLTAPGSVVDGRTVRLAVGWQTRSGEPVAGPVVLQRRYAGGPWRRVTRLTTGQQGTATYAVRPRTDTWWRAVAPQLPWVTGGTTRAHRIRNVPPGEPVRLPRAAPSPRNHVPPQPRAVGQGANPVITRIPDRIWSQMVGVSWHSGCPVGRSGLRLLRINYWDYSGYRRRGELVAAPSAIGQMAGALADLYRGDYPLRSLYRVDRFGYSARSHGGNDYASMAAGNSYAFDCRDVTGNPGTLSPHAYGRSIDLNTWENPYRSAQGIVPDSWWQGHSDPRVAWRSASHAVVRIMARHGLRWTYGLGDTQHFDAVVQGRVLPLPPACRHRICD